MSVPNSGKVFIMDHSLEIKVDLAKSNFHLWTQPHPGQQVVVIF